MRFAFLIILFVASAITSSAQAGALATVDALFTAIRTADTAAARTLFAPSAQLQTISERSVNDGFDRQEFTQSNLDEFIVGLGSLIAGRAEERVGRYDLNQDGDLASVWVPYAFYLDGTFSHCGTNLFTLVRRPSGRWLILTVIDTRRKSDCPELNDTATIATLDTLINRWHRAAAVADEVTFFGTMSADGIYLGTDASERWLRDSMAVWADPYFQRESAWAFTPRERHWYFSDDGQTAWFEEHLDSWMGVVRGSGVLTKVDAPNPLGNRWELRHYNLTLAVPNVRMDAVRMAIDSTAVPR